MSNSIFIPNQSAAPYVKKRPEREKKKKKRLSWLELGYTIIYLSIMGNSFCTCINQKRQKYLHRDDIIQPDQEAKLLPDVVILTEEEESPAPPSLVSFVYYTIYNHDTIETI